MPKVEPDPLSQIRQLPRATANSITGSSAPRPWRRIWWNRPRVFTFSTLTVLALLVLQASGARSVVGAVLMALTSTAAALTLTTYVPDRGQSVKSTIGSPCGVTAAIFPIWGVLSAGGSGAGVGGLLMGLAFTGMGLSQRLLGATACGVPTGRE